MNQPSKLKIWGRMSSINVKKVVWAAQELGIDFERLEAGGLFGVVKTPAYIALNPNAQIPVLQDGDYVLWESNVMTRYLCATYSNSACSLYPADLAQRFDAERWMEWQQTTVNPASRNGFWHLIRLPASERVPALIAQSNAAVEPLMALLDAHLAQRRFVAGDAFSMADIPLGCEIHRWFGLPQPRQARPHIERWFAELCARPAAKGVLDMALS
ncbi:MAG: glutathione S-transferase [Chitinophagaceae bacterium]|nr:glutathione S-transferase [Polaromonas sp.]